MSFHSKLNGPCWEFGGGVEFAGVDDILSFFLKTPTPLPCSSLSSKFDTSLSSSIGSKDCG